ncbi:Six-hairpin glycosidase-like protein [Zopfochytrium polystomum]|nr:Six-hairpin glycosidase-like protein [Zopfochytrium polystomum]
MRVSYASPAAAAAAFAALLLVGSSAPAGVSAGASDGGTTEGSETQFCPTHATQIYSAYSYLQRQANKGTANSGSPYYFTQPSLFKYGAGQWLWDSCGAIIANTHRNVDDAITEFRTLMAAQVANGMVPEEISWPSGSGNSVSQMPTIPWALQTIFNNTGDVTFLKEQVPKVAAYLDWWRNTRDLGDGLVVTVHPWETGIDASPAYDAAWHFTPTGSDLVDYPILYLKFPELQSYYANTWNNNYTAILARQSAESSITANWFVVQDIAINTLVAAGWGVLGDLASQYDPVQAAKYYAKNAAHEAAIKSRMWDASLKRFVTTFKDQDGSFKSSSVQTIQSLFPLLLRSLTSDQRSAIIADIIDPNKFWTAYPFPSVSKAESTYHPKYVYNLLWRGPSWGFTNWFVVHALLTTGNRPDIASAAVDRWAAAISVNGVWEMWNPDTGVGYGAEGLGMSSTFVDALYRTNKVNSTYGYSGNGLNVTTDLWASGEQGSATGGDPYDDSWWVGAYGRNARISKIFLAGGTRVDQIAITYADARSSDTYTSVHGDVGTSATKSITLAPGVNVASTISCIGQYGGGRRVFYVQFKMTDGSSIDIGTTTSQCYTNTPPAGMRIVALSGRSGSANDKVGFYGYY